VEVLSLIFMLGIVTPIATLGFVVFYWSRARGDDRLTDAWRGYARRRGRVFRAPEGTWPNRTSPSVHWTESGATYRVEGQGAENIVRTCVVARPVVAVLGELLVGPRGGEADVRPGARPLAHHVVWCHPADLADRVLTADVKRALLGFNALSLFYRSGEVSLRWAGAEANDARLDEASAVVRRVLAALATTHGSAGGAPEGRGEGSPEASSG
jgi:hypothetical protein